MLKYFIFAVIIWAVSATEQVPHVEQKFIKEIKEGPYQNYSGQPLVDLGGKFYYFEMNVASSWSEASSFCRSLGLFLVSIEDATENNLIKDYIVTNIGRKDFWTSGSDSAQEGSYMWTSTGQPVLFTDWHTGEPNNVNDREDILGLWYENGVLRWNDLSDTHTAVYAICEEEI